MIGSQREKYKSPSYQIREGDSVNIDVTSPGATLALGMMYFNTGNRYSYGHKAATSRNKCVLSTPDAELRVLLKFGCCQLKNRCFSIIFKNYGIFISGREGIIFIPRVLFRIHVNS